MRQAERVLLLAGMAGGLAAGALAQEVPGSPFRQEVEDAIAALYPAGERPPEWSDELALEAEQWVGQCSLDLDDQAAPQTLARGGTDSFTVEGAVKAWFDEVSGQGSSDSAVSSSAFAGPSAGDAGSLDTNGHFADLAWDSVRYLGCGVTRCGEFSMMGCNYALAQPFDRDYPYAEGEAEEQVAEKPSN